ncbi:hypothetical protein MMC07_001536 [Pseudocyphellaria aurata]|nr:hypothetical protein [Pseudocyphellaria aurata]
MESASFRLTFGIEMEFVVHYDLDRFKDQYEAREKKSSHGKHDEYANLVRQDMVQTLNQNGFPANHIRPSGHSKWTVDDDMTIAPDDYDRENWCAVEVKSPALYHSGRALEHVKRVVEFLVSKFDLSVNETCGLHVHVGNEHKGFAMGTLKTFASLFTVFEHQLESLHDIDRLENMYAKPVRRVFPNDATPREKLSMIGQLETVDALVRQFHTVQVDEWGDPLDVIDAVPDRDMAFNFSNLQPREPYQTIEFRQHEGTLDSDAINHWIQLACSLVERSRTGQVHLGDLIQSHMDDANYTVVDFLKDLALPDLAEFYA